MLHIIRTEIEGFEEGLWAWKWWRFKNLMLLNYYQTNDLIPFKLLWFKNEDAWDGFMEGASK